ncbi:hypothetical protein [Mesorhizobium sp. Cs1299R1N3]|uniref:hypothetical protein n=1 Tax=Mesorhizobium sp. Cs1299R1N3 TaxID=3015173 RepID=UPI00301D713D
MTIMCTVSITGTTVEKIREVSKERPDLGEKLGKLLKQHGLIAHRRFYNGNEVLDLDEWETEEGFHAFIKEARPIIDELARLRGADIPTDKVWYPF